jgi:hypothetical protein
MIAKGNLHGDGAKLIDYILKAEQGERVEFGGARGFDFFNDDLVEAARLMQRMADVTTNCQKAWFHTQTRLAPGEHLTLAQWEETLDREEKRLGFTGQPRAWSFHIDEATGEKHLHAAWYRVDVEQERAIDPGLFKLRLKELSRTLEKEFALREVGNHRQADDRARYANRNEVEESRRLGTDVRAIRNVILDCFEKSDSGKAFVSAIRAQGGIIAAGDRRDCFAVVDPAGGQHALNKRLTGMTLAEIRARLSDLEHTQLPSGEQAQETQRARQVARESRQKAAQEQKHGRGAETPGQATALSDARARGRYAGLAPAPEPAKTRPPLGQTAGEIRLAWSVTRARGADQLAEEIKARGLILVYVTADQAKESYRKHAFAKAVGRQNRVLREGFAVVDQRGTVTRIDQRVTGDLRAEIDKRLGGIDRSGLMNVNDARQVMRDANRAAWDAEREQRRAVERMNRPLGKTAGEIRMAWSLTKTPAQFDEALRPHSMTVARVTAAEAYESERNSAFAKEVGNYGRSLKEGELVVVNGFGSTYRLDEATTGNFRPEIDKRLAGFDPDKLLSVADATVAMREASRIAYREEQEKARPATKIETVIAGALRSTMTGHDFAAAIDKAGLTITRTTAADLTALAALRRNDELAAATGLEASALRFAKNLEIGDFAAVTRRGNVYRLNPHKLDLKEIEQRLADTQRRMPSVIEARAGYETARKNQAALSEQRGADNAARRVARDEAITAQRGIRSAGRTAYRETGKTAKAAEKAAGKGAGILGRGVLGALAGLFKLFDLFPAKPPSPEQQKRNYYAAKEQQATDDIAAKKDATDEQQRRQQNAQQQEKDLRLRQILGTAPTAEANVNREEHDRQRERERELRRDR